MMSFVYCHVFVCDTVTVFLLSHVSGLHCSARSSADGVSCAACVTLVLPCDLKGMVTIFVALQQLFCVRVLWCCAR